MCRWARVCQWKIAPTIAVTIKYISSFGYVRAHLSNTWAGQGREKPFGRAPRELLETLLQVIIEVGLIKFDDGN
jgi:hypothetical protein